ncbi:Hypothetical protein, putative [Bodo saltans]|uniref:ATP-dependent RNA helicase n=1 Tax=Bodo saltans TaxID=75058 RepID=A0A0S4IWL5_BODSA|nr:Hypothetical protein, putative [Bodo saltans]|eukprot:CUF76058.1 Hypothetical protein, putative [Bodo saltans]
MLRRASSSLMADAAECRAVPRQCYGALTMIRGSSSTQSTLSSTFAALCISRRHVVQSHAGSPQSIFQRYKLNDARMELKRNSKGNYYRLRHQKLFPSTEALEVALTEDTYSPVERVAVPLLSPADQKAQRRHQQNLVARGRSTVTLLEGNEEIDEENVIGREPTTTTTTSQLLVQPEDLLGTPLESAVASTSSSSSSLAGDRENANAQRDMALSAEVQRNSASHTTWTSLAPRLIDPIVANLATLAFGPTATRLQLRLLRALLNEDHNDVLMGGADGGGKTSALLLALLQGMRSESTGVNVLVASTAMNAKRATDVLARLIAIMDSSSSGDTHHHTGSSSSIRSIDDREGLLDDGQPMKSWLLVAPFRESVDTYANIIKATDRRRVRLMITTADVFCELLFEHKTQFEHLGYLRRVYVDDCVPQLQMLPDDAPSQLVKERLRDPVALEMLLGTLHQLAGPHIRSIMQIACVSAGLEAPTVEHLKQLSVKLDAKEVALSPTHQLPSNIHCTFCFRSLLGRRHHSDVGHQTQSTTMRNDFLGSNEADDSAHPFSIYHFVAKVLWSAASTICGRVIIFVRQEHDILAVRKVLRKLGMDARLLSEVVTNTNNTSSSSSSATTEQQQQQHATTRQASWKFVLMREHEGVGVHLPLVSHVVITFPPTGRASFLHMSSRTGHLGSRGWVLTIADQRDARQVRDVVEQVQVDFLGSVVELQNGAGGQLVFEKVPSADIDRKTRDPPLYGLDPQYAVLQQYDQLTENPDLAGLKTELFMSKDANAEFYWEDYTPVPELQGRHDVAKRIAEDIERDPSFAQRLQADGMLDAQFKPTANLRTSIRGEAKLRSNKYNRRRGGRGQLPHEIMEMRNDVKQHMFGRGRGSRGGRGVSRYDRFV